MAKAKVKAAFPKEGIARTITQPVEVKLLHDFDRYSNGSMLMTITDAEVKRGDKVLGSIRMDIAGTQVGCIIGGRMWSISIRELWLLFEAADEAHQKEG